MSLYVELDKNMLLGNNHTTSQGMKPPPNLFSVVAAVPVCVVSITNMTKRSQMTVIFQVLQ
jgi:hypothetical protein